MRDTDLLQLALGIMPPWLVDAATFDADKKRLDIEINFARGGRFPWGQPCQQRHRSDPKLAACASALAPPPRTVLLFQIFRQVGPCV
jgi:hypothetical protein